MILISPPFWRAWWFLLCLGALVASALFSASRWKLARMRRREESAEEFSRRLISQQEAERKRIARELHDGLGQEFIIISNRARRGLKSADVEQARGQLEAIVEASTRALGNVREIALDLSPYHLEHFGLCATIRSMAQRLAEDAQLDMSLELADVDARIDKQAHIHVFRIVQEAVTNIVKHARATRATVAISEKETSIEIRITDNGTGFSVAGGGEAPSERGGMGLPGLAERAKLLGGAFTIDSVPGRGCAVTVLLPAHSGQTPENKHDEHRNTAS
jgi:signal transduction histidine kinase